MTTQVEQNPPHPFLSATVAQLFVSDIKASVFIGDIRQREHLLSGTIEVNTAAQIKQLFLDFQTAGVKFH
jgi:hypothetical protein